MPTPTLSAIRTAAVSQLATAITSMTFYPRQPIRIQTPACFLRRLQGPTWLTMGGCATVTFELVVLVDWRGGERAQETLDTIVEASGSTSIRGALEANRTLGSVVDSLNVGEWGEDDLVEVNGTEYGSASVPLEVQYR